MVKKKRILLGRAIVVLLALLAVPVLSVYAQSATNDASWDSSITYYTPSDTGGTLQVSYYPEDGSAAIQADPITLQGHKAGSLYIGSVSGMPTTFAGSAVLSADVPIIATNVQFAAGGQGGEYGRLLYNGFQGDEAATTFYIPTVLRQVYGSTSMVAIQNAENSPITANLRVYAPGSTTPTVDEDYAIPAQSSEILSASEMPGMPVGFTGSAVISATGRVVASAQETDDAGRGAYAFEGVANGSNRFYMPTMLCNVYGGQISYYAIQNAGSVTATTSITFYNTAGAVVATMPPTVIEAGNKLSVNPCDEGVPAGTSGSAVIESTGAPVIAMGKVKAPNGMATAFIGQAGGSTRVAMPYIRWAADPYSEWRSYVACMNVGSAPATSVVAHYYDGNGNEVGSGHVIASTGDPLDVFIKRNTTAPDAGALDGNGNFGISPYGGAVEVESDQPIVCLVRVQRDVNLGATTRFAEDYNGTDVSSP